LVYAVSKPESNAASGLLGKASTRGRNPLSDQDPGPETS